MAARLGAPWDGPGDPTAAAVDVDPDVPPWEVLDRTREALVAADAATRRRLGAHHTPHDLARRLAALVVDRPDAVVADPACGGGAFLVAAGQLLVEHGADRRHVVEHQLLGADIDPLAVATTKAALAAWAGAHQQARIDVADGLTWRPATAPDVVVGNPPFRSPLAAGAPAGRLAAYTNLASRFLVAAVDLVRPDGKVLLIQPESVLAARDAGPVRAVGTIAGLWLAGEPAFGADVRVCAVLLQDGARCVRRWTGLAVTPAGSVTLDRGAPTWAHLRPGAPPARTTTTRTIGDLATAAAGFRDEFYGLAAAAREADDCDGPPLITSGLIDPGRLLWGEKPARIAGRRYERPTVDLAALTPRLRSWVDARRTPKVMVATQTKQLEAAADPTGDAVPLTPVIAVHPHDLADLDRILATLHHPGTTAWAHRHYGGLGLNGDVVKLSASQVLAIPLV